RVQGPHPPLRGDRDTPRQELGHLRPEVVTGRAAQQWRQGPGGIDGQVGRDRDGARFLAVRPGCDLKLCEGSAGDEPKTRCGCEQRTREHAASHSIMWIEKAAYCSMARETPSALTTFFEESKER